MKRDFKANGKSYTVTDKASGFSEDFKYDLLVFNESQGGWNRVCSCNTLQQARDKANDIEFRATEIETENELSKEREQEYIKELLSKEHYCIECNTQITNEDDIINGFDYCKSCLMKEC